ncbi:Alcohol dehydrogenase [Rhodotorula kratochvilovae]
MPVATSPTIPKTCRAAVCRNPGPDYTLELVEDYPVPSPARGQLLLKINATGLCVSDHHNMAGDIGVPMGCDVAGHEGAGVVVALGEGVEGWKVGDRAGIKPLFDVCHECAHCHSGDEGLCSKYIVSPARYTTRIPDGVEDKYAAPMMCSGTTIYTAIKRSGIRAGQWLVLPGGGGGVGHLGIAFARVQGIRTVVIDTGAEKRALCERLGADAFVDFKTCADPAKEVASVTGGGGHVVVVTGGTAAAYASAPAYLRAGGTLLCVGLPPAGTAIAGADPCAIIFRKLTIKGSLTGNHADADEALEFVQRGLVQPHVTVRPFGELKEAFADLLAAKVAGRMVIDFSL